MVFKEKCLILDFDDTLIKTIPLHIKSWKFSIDAVLQINTDVNEIIKTINYGTEELLQKYNLSSEQYDHILFLKKEYYLSNIHETQVNQLLLYLIESKFFETYVIASNSSKENIIDTLDYHNINKSLFNLIISKEDVKLKKPYPDMGTLIFSKYANKYKKSDYLYIGDSDVDQNFSNAIGTKFISVNF